MMGAFLGAKVSGAAETVMKYLPLCLFSQASVAIGLSILAFQRFPGTIGNSIVVIVTLTTFVAELLGPSAVKYAVVKGREAGLNVTDEDILGKTRIREVMNETPLYVYENTHLKEILKVFR